MYAKKALPRTVVCVNVAAERFLLLTVKVKQLLCSTIPFISLDLWKEGGRLHCKRLLIVNHLQRPVPIILFVVVDFK